MAYPGGKSAAGTYQKIINLMPEHRLYCEPFLGGGAVLKIKKPARATIAIESDAAVIEKHWTAAGITGSDGEDLTADIDGGVLRDLAPAKMTILPWSTIAQDGERRRSSELTISDRDNVPSPLARSGEQLTPPDLASSAVTVMADVGAHSPYSAWGSANINTDEGARPRGLTIIHGDGIQFLREFDFPTDALVYCDPPYMIETLKSRGQYTQMLSNIEHDDLLRILLALPCQVMISGYWHTLYATMLQDWNHTSFRVTTRGNSPAQEHLWFNFDPPAAKEQHDLKHAGKNYRDRERIKRKVHRWKENFSELPSIERRLILSELLQVDLGVSS